MWYVVNETTHEIISEHGTYQEAYAESFRMNRNSSDFYLLYNEQDAHEDGMLDTWNAKKVVVR